MKLLVRWIASMAIVSATPIFMAPAQTSPEFSNSKIVLYEGEPGDGGYWTTNASQTKPVNPRNEVFRTRLMQRRALEEYAEFLSPLRLPFTLRLYASDCDGKLYASPHYTGSDPGSDRGINMCYSFIRWAEDAIPYLEQRQQDGTLWTPVTPEQYLVGLYTAVLLHETGHALSDQLDLPVFGREEDAADQIAAYIALQFGKADARTIIKGFAYFWEAAGDPSSFSDYSDTHGTASQRLYNTLCMAYGGDPDTFRDFVDSGWLSPERAKQCAGEYQQVDFAFKKTILPFIDQGQMKKVQARQWFQPSEKPNN